MPKRKMRIPVEKQVRGLRKALANRKTPRQFLPSLRKRLAKLTA
jgi:ribosomal protein L28